MKKTFILLVVFFLPLAAFAADATNTFVPLTSLPIEGSLNTSGDFSSLVNALYKICIGIVALIAVFQIGRAGFMYMAAGDNEESISNARHLIGNAVLGLVLVLSPYIVFGIINKDILSLKIGNINQLTSLPSGSAASSPSSSSGTPSLAQQICKGYSSFQWAQVPANKQCSDVLSSGWATLPDNVCCAGTAPNGAVCCGFDKNYTPPTASVFQGPYAFSIEYQDTDNSGKACVAFDDSNGYTKQSDCTTAYNNKIAAAKNPYAIARSCTDSGVHTPTGPGAAALAKLPTCKN